MEVLYPHCAGLDVHKDTVVSRRVAGSKVVRLLQRRRGLSAQDPRSLSTIELSSLLQVSPFAHDRFAEGLAILWRGNGGVPCGIARRCACAASGEQGSNRAYLTDRP